MSYRVDEYRFVFLLEEGDKIVFFFFLFAPSAYKLIC